MKKLLLPLMMMLATIAVVPGNKGELIKVNAEEETTSDVTNKTKKVEKGYITNKLVNDSGVVDLTGDTLTTFNSNVFSNLTAKPISYDDSMFKTTFLKYTEANKVLTGPTVDKKTLKFVYKSSSDNYNNTKWDLTSYVQSGTIGSYDSTKERFFTIKYGLDYAFEDWDTTKEQPLELAIPINLSDIETGLKRCFPFIQAPSILPNRLFKTEQTFPIISINGYDYFTATLKFGVTAAGAAKTTITYNTNNARAYIAYDENGDYANYVFMEIPFTNYLQTISIAQYVKTVNNAHTVKPTMKRVIRTLTGAVNKAFKAPIVITDLDFNKGTVTTLTSNSVYIDSNNNATINAVDTDYVRLDSLVIDNEYTLYAKQTGQRPIEREEIYELYTDEAFKNRFTYSSNNALANKLQNAEDDVQINITKYNYSILTKTSEDDTEYATAADFVNCGNYYGFKKINKDQIHTATFNAFAARNAFYSRLAFNVYDNQAEMHINKINALWFTYKFKGEDMSLCITGKELDDTVSGGESIPQWAIYINPVVKYIKYFQDKANTFYTKDKYLTKFGLHGMKDTDYFCFMDDWDAIHEYKQSNMFLLYTKETDVVFDSLVSCVYVDKAGDLINCSTIFPNGVEAPTAIIGEDGKVTIKDVNGKTIPGSVDKDGFFVDDKGERWDYPDNVPQPTDKWQEILDTIKKIGAILGTAAIVGGVAFVISQVGPTLVMIFKKKE